MKKIASLFTLLFLIGCVNVMAQNGETWYNLDASLNGDTINSDNTAVFDDGGPNGDYTRGYDYRVLVESTCAGDTADAVLCIPLGDYNIGRYDTVYIYDGPTINDPLLIKFNSFYASAEGNVFYMSARNTSGYMLIRFRTDIQHPDDTARHFGFRFKFECSKPCENIVPVIDSLYDRVNVDGTIIRDYKMRDVPTSFDTVWEKEYVWIDSLNTYQWVNTDSIIRIDTTGWTLGAFLCQGQCIVLHGHGEYTNRTGWYSPVDSTTTFNWVFTVGDTTSGLGMTRGRTCAFNAVGCYDVHLDITDVNDCKNRVKPVIQVRVAQNPIKTIFDLSTICNDDSLLVNVGYDGDNGTLTLRKIVFRDVVSKTNEVRTFIPDGPRCDVRCYEAPVLFNEFPAGKTIEAASDICSICVNYEHSYMGDYSMSILCPIYDVNTDPNRGKATLKWKETSEIPDGYRAPEGTTGGGGRYTGVPFAGDGHDAWDATNSCNSNNNKNCDSICNPFGVGYDYCFSRNGQYTFVNGDPADNLFPTGAGLANGPTIGATETMPVMQAPFCNAGVPFGPATVTTAKPSNHEEKNDYYIPGDDFSTLVGCPLNGEWNIQICDNFSIDNGWIFNWSMDICNVSAGGGCDYQVSIDSVVWRPDTAATDFYMGEYRGLRINKKISDASAAYISSPDTAGNFKIKLSIYDEFGCQWDTLTKIATVYTPTPHLGNDTILCDVQTMQLDATDKNTSSTYTYNWEPFGETTGIITTTPKTNSDHQYVVEVVNQVTGKQCYGRDTIIVKVNPQPIPNFDPGIFPLEGCEPLTINVVNTTRNGYKYRWVFGDGTYSTLKNPSHSYAAGNYDFKYYVESEAGCKDSLIYPDLIHVYPTPDAQFSWEPTFPTVANPSVQLINNTSHDDGSNLYFWEIQYSNDNPYSFHTLTNNNPTFTWTAAPGEDISGSYTIRLLARSDNYAPSGQHVVCADTLENKILIINDQLVFPNVVTPNGDGINDIFIIKNLVEGLAYPINQLDIFDKWGTRCFHAENISSIDQFWDPNATNAPAGTYFFRFSGKGYQGNMEHNGAIEVLR